MKPVTSKPTKEHSSKPSLPLTPKPTPFPSQSQASVCININLNFDHYPSDTSWEIESISDKSVVAKSPQYGDSFTTNSSHVCLPDGDYAFVITDKYNDGM